jgi:FAD synthetase
MTKKVMVFGVFDGVHEGHEAILKEAKALGDHLIVVVAQDHIVQHLKGHQPKINLTDRFEHLKKADMVDEVVIGDAELGTWEVVKKEKPDVIALGYDQESLKADLEAHMDKFEKKPELVVMKSYEPNTYHSSLIKKEE